MSASYTRLRSGEWGGKSDRPVKAGDVITVTKKDGKARQETVSRLIWTDNATTWLFSISKSPAAVGGDKPARPSGRARGGCKGCGGPIVNASHHRAMGGYCGSCAFDEFDC